MTPVTDGFTRELITRLPLARAVMEVFHFAFGEQLLADIYDRHRGRCYTDELKFPRMVELVRDSLLEHGGSAHRLFTELERNGQTPADESSFYRKLANMPVSVSRGLLRQCTQRLTQLIEPASQTLPECVRPFTVVVYDGKKLKRAARRLKPTRGYRGALLAAKTLVAMDLRTRLAIALSDSLDGEANDIPLLPALLPQVWSAVRGPTLSLSDRQFSDYKTFRLMLQREGDHLVLRMRAGLHFEAESALTRETVEAEGRPAIDEVGPFGVGRNAVRMRRITLRRKNAEGKDDDVVLLTDLLDQDRYPAADLLSLYRQRWGIEQMFQEVTETFSLEHLIGSSPRAAVFQASLCLLMYNLIQVVKTYVAEDGGVPQSSVSTRNLFYDVKRELQTCSYLAPQALLAAAGDVPEDCRTMQRRLRKLLKGSWDPIAYTKAVDRRPRPPRPRGKSLPGGHTSVQRLLDGRVKVRACQRR